MKIDELREQIDTIDEKMVRLIAERMRVAGDIGMEKKERGRQIGDVERERKVMDNIQRIAREENISWKDVEGIYRRLITVSRGVQGMTVAFQGEIGAYSEEAAYRFFGASIQLKPCESLADVFQAVTLDEAHFGIVPMENSLEGSVSGSYDLLLESQLKVCGETELRIVHCLIGMPESRLDLIKRVYSHPQALGQSRAFLKHLGCELITMYDTAGSVKMLKEQGSIDAGAVASARAAEIYGMKILAREIEDNPNNFTRFFILSSHDSPRTGNDKTSLVFSVKHKPGALYESLKTLADCQLNMTKIESRPTRQKQWEYHFYVDVEGHRDDKNFKEAIAGLENTTLFIKVLGSYPRTSEVQS